MLISYEEYKKHPDIANMDEIEKESRYTIGVAYNGDYLEALEYIFPKLTNQDEMIQFAAVQGIGILTFRFHKIDDERILPILFNNIISKNKLLYGVSLEALYSAAELAYLRKKIYTTFFKIGVDFHLGKILPVYKRKIPFISLKTEEEIEKYILSLCQNCDNYEEAFGECLNILSKYKTNSDDITDAVFKGLGYLIMRFNKIDFERILPILLEFLPPKEEIGRVYAESVLADIALYIPEFKEKSISILKQINSCYLKKYKLGYSRKTRKSKKRGLCG
jgi:hypothetical protein